MHARVFAVSSSPHHGFSKPAAGHIALLAGLGVAGDAHIVRITGLRNPRVQIDRFQPGLMAAVLGRDAAGHLVRKAGVMGVVLVGGGSPRTTASWPGCRRDRTAHLRRSSFDLAPATGRRR